MKSNISLRRHIIFLHNLKLLKWCETYAAVSRCVTHELLKIECYKSVKHRRVKGLKDKDIIFITTHSSVHVNTFIFYFIQQKKVKFDFIYIKHKKR